MITEEQFKILVKEIASLKSFEDRVSRINYREGWEYEEDLLKELGLSQEKGE